MWSRVATKRVVRCGCAPGRKQHCDALRRRAAEGLRVLSYTIRRPHKVLEFLQLSKEVAERGYDHKLQDGEFEEKLTGSDDDIREFLDQQIGVLLSLLHEVRRPEESPVDAADDAAEEHGADDGR